jgi:putative endonuclease
MTPPPGPGFRNWPWWRRWFGRRSERYAAKHLRRVLRHRVLAANVADAAGELDLLTLDPDGKTLVVVEVRSVSGPDPTRAAESVDLAKQTRVAATALRFLTRRRLLNHPVRFDVLAIAWPPGQPPVVHYHPDAFQPPGRFQFYT